MQEMTYFYDGSFEGFLCCVFESYQNHEVLTAITCDEDFLPGLFASRAITTDAARAQRVYRGLARRSERAARLVYRGFLSCMAQREMHLYRLAVKVFDQGPGFLRNLSDETLFPVLRAVRHLEGEAQLLRGFVRFSELGGVLGSEIEPKNRVLPLLRGHFCGRFQNETFFIYDRTHKEILLYAGGKSSILPLEHFEMARPDAAEAQYRQLWKRFYDSIAIRERYNPKCRMTQMPKRYWNTMTEFQDESYFIPESSPADAAIPAAPNGRSAPGIPPAPGPSAPGSGP